MFNLSKNPGNFHEGKRNLLIQFISTILPLWGCSSVVERPLRMRKAPGSIPGTSIVLFKHSVIFIFQEKRTLHYVSNFYLLQDDNTLFLIISRTMDKENKITKTCSQILSSTRIRQDCASSHRAECQRPVRKTNMLSVLSVRISVVRIDYHNHDGRARLGRTINYYWVVS